MRVPRPKSMFTVDEYLRLERATTERHEFLDGHVYAMAGESGKHGDISVNIVGTFHGQLKGKPCRARSKDTKVRSGPQPKNSLSSAGMFSYPDLVVICGEPEYHDHFTDVVLNPTLILEVLSESTEAFDRGEKMIRFQTWNPTLQDYLLVSQDRPRIEHYTRQPDGGWSYHVYEGLQASVFIASLQCTLPLAEVYDRVTFSEASPLPP